MQSIPANSLLQLLGQPPAKPGSPVRLDLALADNNAFASALELLLTGMPASLPGGDAPKTTDLATRLLLGAPETETANPQGSPIEATAIPIPAAGNTKTILPQPADASALASLMTLVPQSSGFVSGDAKIGSRPAEVPVELLPSLTSAAESTANSDLNPGVSTMPDPTIPANATRVQFLLPSHESATPQLPLSMDDSGTLTVASGVKIDPVTNEIAREFTPIPLPIQPHVLAVSDQQVEPPVEGSGEKAAIQPKTGTLHAIHDGNPHTQATLELSAGKQLTAKPENTSIPVNSSEPVLPSITPTTGPSKSELAAPTIPLQVTSNAILAKRTLDAKTLDTPGSVGARTDARGLVAKASELGVKSMSVQFGNEGGKSVNRLKSLPTNDEGTPVRTIPKDAMPVTPSLTSSPRNRHAERCSKPNDPVSKLEDSRPRVESHRPVELTAKSTHTAQESSVRPVSTSNEIATESAQPVFTPRFVVEGPKPIRIPGQITLRMEPSDLGPLTIDLQAGTEGIIGKLRFGSEAVRSVVEQDMSQLRRALSDAGIRVERLDIVGVSPSGERSAFSSQTPQDHQAPHRDPQSQGRNYQPGDRPAYNQRERGQRPAPEWNAPQQSPWVTINRLSSSLNLVA